MLLLRPPGVYRPQSDTRLLLDAFEAAAIPPGGTVLDVGTGTGAIAIAAAKAGARRVTAADVSLSAVITARLNAKFRRARVFVEHGDALDLALGRKFDLILANPPYVPASAPDPRIGAAPEPGTQVIAVEPSSTASAPSPRTCSPRTEPSSSSTQDSATPAPPCTSSAAADSKPRSSPARTNRSARS